MSCSKAAWVQEGTPTARQGCLLLLFWGRSMAHMRSGRGSRDNEGCAGAKDVAFQNSQPDSEPNPKPARTKTRLDGEDMPAAWGRSDSTPATISVQTVTCPLRQLGLDCPGETQGSGPNPH